MIRRLSLAHLQANIAYLKARNREIDADLVVLLPKQLKWRIAKLEKKDYLLIHPDEDPAAITSTLGIIPVTVLTNYKQMGFTYIDLELRKTWKKITRCVLAQNPELIWLDLIFDDTMRFECEKRVAITLNKRISRSRIRCIAIASFIPKFSLFAAKISHFYHFLSIAGID